MIEINENFLSRISECVKRSTLIRRNGYELISLPLNTNPKMHRGYE